MDKSRIGIQQQVSQRTLIYLLTTCLLPKLYDTHLFLGNNCLFSYVPKVMRLGLKSLPAHF